MTARLSLAFLALALFTLSVTTLLVTHSVRGQFLQLAETNLRRHAESVATLLGRSMEEVALTREQRRRLVEEMTRLSEQFRGRMCIVNWKGQVLEDSDPDGEKQVKHHLEVYEALNGRYHAEEREGWLYLAVPIQAKSETQGAIYASRPLDDLEELMSGLYRRLGLVAAVALLLSAFLSLLLGAFVSRPVVRLSEGVKRISQGDYEHRLSLSRRDELGRLAADVDRMAQSLGRHQAILMQFVSDASHELKTPIASLKALNEGLMDGVLEDPVRGERFLQLIAAEIDRMQHLVENLLCLQRLDGDGAEVQPVDFELRKLVLDLLEPLALQHQVTGQGPEIQVHADPQAVVQVLTNLIANAIRAGEPVKVTWAQEDGQVRVSVEDGGPGLSEDELERVFLRFYRTQKSRSRQSGGSGLGLAICRRLIEAHEQRIWLENRSTGGLRANFTLSGAPI